MKRTILSITAIAAGLAAAGSASAATMAVTPIDTWTFVRNDNGAVLTNANTNSFGMAPADGVSPNTLDNAAAEGVWAGPVINLEIGETVIVTGSVSWSGAGTLAAPGSTGIRLGLFNSDGTLANGSPGYKALTEDITNNTFANLFTGRTNGFMMSNSSNAVSLGATVNSETGMWENDQSYDFTFEIERTGATSVQVRFLMSGGSATPVNIDAFGNHAGSPTLTFNSFAMTWGDNDIDAAAFSNVNIQVVPEPASLGLLALAGLTLVARKRRA